MDIEDIVIDFVRVGNRARPVNQEAVRQLASSIEAVGLRTPITVHIVDEVVEDDGTVAEGVPYLVAGHHRLEAARSLGWKTIPAVVADGTEVDFRLWEIAENLHRADLSVQERSEHIAEWVRLTEEKGKLVQVAPVSGRGRIEGRGNEGGIRAASRDLGITRETAHRAIKIAAMSDEAKVAAKEAGLGDNQSALLKAASAPHAQQAAVIADLAAEKRAREEDRRSQSKPVPMPKNELETEEDWRNGMMRLWNRAPDEWRERFIDYVQAPVFDNTRAGRG